MLASASAGRLSKEDFSEVEVRWHNDFVVQTRWFAVLLQPLGATPHLELVQRRSLGDDGVFTYQVVAGGRTLRIRLGLTPRDQISEFEIQPG